MEKDESHYSGIYRGKKLDNTYSSNLYDKYKETLKNEYKRNDLKLTKHTSLYEVYKETKK
jgi:hypothetical protein